jgi:MinD-like ATPase involved in chromosome partitioning or flagellar assembly
MSFSIISICASPQLRETLEFVSQALRYDPVTVINEYITPADKIGLDAVPDSLPVVVISLDDNLEAGLVTAGIFSKMQNPKFRVIVASTSRDGDVIIGIIKAGYDLLSLPTTTGEVLTALKRVTSAAHLQAAAKDAGKIYLFAGTSGGGGTTTIATHVAVALATEGKKTLLVDHHRSLGHAALYLDIGNKGRSIYDCVENESRLDDDLFRSYIVSHPGSELDVLCSPQVVTAGFGEDKLDTFKSVVSFLRTQYSYIIFDMNASDREMGFLSAEAEKVFFVTSAEVAPMRDLLRYCDFLGSKGNPKFQVVVNHEGRSPITAIHLGKHADLVVAAKFAELAGHVPAATNAGKTVEPEVQSFHESLNTLLNAIDPQPVQEATKKKNWFSLGSLGKGR